LKKSAIFTTKREFLWPSQKMLNSSKSMKGASTHWKRLWSKLKDFRRKRISWIQSSLLAEWKSLQKPIIDLHHLLTNLKHGFFVFKISETT
jgi:hypothetical protein